MTYTILLIEDNEQNRYLATFLLEARGHRVVAAEDGRRGLELAPALLPDLILLDIQLPGLNGYAVASALRESPGLREVPIVAVTSHAMAGDREQALNAGCSGYITKPINPDSFVREIEDFLPSPRRTT